MEPDVEKKEAEEGQEGQSAGKGKLNPPSTPDRLQARIVGRLKRKTIGPRICPPAPAAPLSSTSDLPFPLSAVQLIRAYFSMRLGRCVPASLAPPRSVQTHTGPVSSNLSFVMSRSCQRQDFLHTSSPFAFHTCRCTHTCLDSAQLQLVSHAAARSLVRSSAARLLRQVEETRKCSLTHSANGALHIGPRHNAFVSRIHLGSC